MLTQIVYDCHDGLLTQYIRPVVCDSMGPGYSQSENIQKQVYSVVDLYISGCGDLELAFFLSFLFSIALVY